MRIAVTGGTGFIGKRLTALLLERGHDLLLVGRHEAGSAPSDRLSFHAADLADPGSYLARLTDYRPEAACHLAWEGIPDFSASRCERNRAQGTAFLDAALGLPSCRRAIAAGSCWEYGMRQGACLEEDPGVPADDFTRAKDALRRHGLARAAQAGKTFGWFRIFYVYGPGQREGSLVPSIISTLRDGREFTPKNPASAQDFIYVDDVAEGLARGLERKWPSGSFNLGSGSLTSVTAIAQMISSLMNRSASILKADFYTSKGNLSGFWASLDRVQRHLDWKPPVGIEEGLRKTLAAFTPDSP